jgi:hypothetical protein
MCAGSITLVNVTSPPKEGIDLISGENPTTEVLLCSGHLIALSTRWFRKIKFASAYFMS